jgi:flagellar export protein FliJ
MKNGLQTLQRLRQLELDRCQIAFGNARRHQIAIRDQLAAACARQAKQVQGFDALKTQGPVSITTIQICRDHLTAIRAEIDKLQSELAKSQQEVQDRLDALAAAELQMKVAEKLQERSQETLAF